uniref:Uncharacterized protein n=1 Tax=Cannabis sativa TaxID=3483 RepID=A0A803P4M4_CANSA
MQNTSIDKGSKYSGKNKLQENGQPRGTGQTTPWLAKEVYVPASPKQKYYTGETRQGIGEPVTGEPHVDLGEDIKLVRLRKVVGQVTQTEEPRVVGCDAFPQQRSEFLRWIDDQEAIL